jgi:hypothetical protein
LVPELARDREGPQDGRHITVGAEIVAVDDRGILKPVAGQADGTSAGGLHESRRDPRRPVGSGLNIAYYRPGTMARPPRVEFPGALYSRTTAFFNRDGASIARDVLALDQSFRDSKELQSRIDNLARSLTRT